ncbi:hypothetical protein FRC10_008430 [Ceratobasidium sp. 414]|nr:hypothetical protein FRC10_008430 [Ceratobasidium sp. 414]
MTDDSHQRILGIPITEKDPPSYDTGVDSEGTTLSGFPTGYFVIRNVATGKLLDVATHSSADGIHLVLWPPKENSLVLPMRSPGADNQLLRVTFGCDPNYPPPRATDPTNAWRSMDYVVAAVPVQRPRSFLENTMTMMSTIGATLSKPQALLANTPASSVAAALGHGGATAAYFALRDDEVLEEDRLRGEDYVDDSPELGRPVHVLRLPIGWLEKAGARLSDEVMRRRQWVVEPLLQRRRSSGA